MKPLRPKFAVSVFRGLSEIVDTNAPSGKLPTGGGKRGDIRKLSVKSHKNLIKLINKIGRTDPCYLVTLTYGNWSPDYRLWKRDLDVFLKALRRRFPDCCGIWRLEFQARGAPHYHLLVWPSAEVDFRDSAYEEDSDWLRLTWGRVSQNQTCSGLKHGSDLALVRAPKEADFYLGLYLQKSGGQVLPVNFTGRHWGAWNRSGLDCFEPLRLVSLDEVELYRLRRIIRGNYLARNGRSSMKSYFFRYVLAAPNPVSWTAFLDSEQMCRILSFLEKTNRETDPSDSRKKGNTGG